MTQETLVAIPCRLSPGMFPSERVFHVALANGNDYHGITPRHFCWNEKGQIVGENEPTEDASGMVAAKFVGPIGTDQAAVEVPDGQVLAVPIEVVQKRPTKIIPPGSSAHREGLPSVSNRS